ncbi:SRPBCC family protein, partial [Actinopolymorpha pittospori]
WSHRSWKATVTEQVPDRKIAWTSEGAKGTTKGVVTFHPLADDLTKVLLVLEYYPGGVVEKTANLWRAFGRRARLDLKHFRRFVSMRGEATGAWRGEIQDGQVVHQPDELEEDRTEDDGADFEDSSDEAAAAHDLDAEDADEYDDPDGEEDGEKDGDFEDEYEESDEDAEDSNQEGGDFEEEDDLADEYVDEDEDAEDSDQEGGDSEEEEDLADEYVDEDDDDSDGEEFEDAEEPDEDTSPRSRNGRRSNGRRSVSRGRESSRRGRDRSGAAAR